MTVKHIVPALSWNEATDVFHLIDAFLLLLLIMDSFEPIFSELYGCNSRTALCTATSDHRVRW